LIRSGKGSDAAVRLLLLDRDSAGSRITARDLKNCLGSRVSICEVCSGRAASEQLRSEKFDIVLLDLGSLADLSLPTEESVTRLSRLADGALVVALSNGTSVSSAVAAMRAGAHDYVAKPINVPAFSARIEELAQRHGKARALHIEAVDPDAVADFEGFIGVSSQMQFVYEQISRISPSSAPAFITGESGTGKEVCAEALHRHGQRAEQPFIAINCGAIPKDLMEAEIFGVTRGAFTGAVDDRKGAAEMANGGTLFLDEVGELDISLQTKLLRFLQTGSVTRIGEAVERRVDVRIICATNRNPMQLIAERKFREDLFYRLHVLPIHLPPLRQRPADILPLARHFLEYYSAEERKNFTGIDPTTADFLVGREWPGNVRQLQNMIRRIVVMFDGGDVSPKMITAADVESQSGFKSQTPETPMRRPQILPMWQQEQRIIEDAISEFGGNIAQAAAALEISPSTIYRKRQSWEEMARALPGAA